MFGTSRRKINKLIFFRKSNLDFLKENNTESELACEGAPNLKMRRALCGGAIAAVALAVILLCGILIPANSAFFCSETDYDFEAIDKSGIPEDVRLVADVGENKTFHRYYLKKNNKRTLFYYQNYVWFDEQNYDDVRVNAVKKNVRVRAFEDINPLLYAETTKNGVKIRYSERLTDTGDSTYYECRFKIGKYVYYVSIEVFDAGRIDYYLDKLTR